MEKDVAKLDGTIDAARSVEGDVGGAKEVVDIATFDGVGIARSSDGARDIGSAESLARSEAVRGAEGGGCVARCGGVTRDPIARLSAARGPGSVRGVARSSRVTRGGVARPLAMGGIGRGGLARCGCGDIAGNAVRDLL